MGEVIKLDCVVIPSDHVTERLARKIAEELEKREGGFVIELIASDIVTKNSIRDWCEENQIRYEGYYQTTYGEYNAEWGTEWIDPLFRHELQGIAALEPYIHEDIFLYIHAIVI